ncbi:hypothetical protein TCAL_09230 [Tigriopus californicus]|uniref:CDP-diacylglycerol--inositol 3-phosphatidyltransferase n=1 Tax=Tigriopus californicus TaxID=6832 RepID=A0A553PGT0_TIGCA|nr:ceramide phosphoethanolamine synthase-like [Tigriopus californicus]TRY76889.1 hypothetical protein TCAL_09230 [Tigriopus californicus]|eukprot:TCALIF_09230-PA protein Name:"Similar to CG4585 Ceramide phosphoethanolamine synthase (Drosophila melanogaster)" AED:0.03 eAED:0.05 QI:0/-1/0/1/-1/1/1/0/345
MANLGYLTLFLLAVAIYFLWMDVALYINLQKVPPTSPTVQPLQTNISDYTYTPFYPITVKLLFQGPTIHYIDTPLGFWTVEYTNIAQWISANGVSIVGVFFAACAAKMFLSDSLKVRQLGVLMFKIRDFMDSLDGTVARARRSQVALLVEPGTFGYYFDGICDAIGDTMIFLAIITYCNRNYSIGAKHGNRLSYLRLDATSISNALPTINKPSCRSYFSFCRKNQPAITLFICIACQALLSSMLWNFSLIKYHNLLETDLYAKNSSGILAQNTTLKSPAMWMIVYFWRILNPHSITQLILIAILYDKAFEYLTTIQYLGYIPILAIGFASQLYARYALSSILTMS